MTPRQIPARRAQKGFIASAAQVTLAIVALAVSATAGSLEAARQQAAAQMVHIHASYLMKVGGDLETALTRAADDNNFPRGGVRGAVVIDGGVAAGSRVDLFDVRVGYGRRPQWPAGLLVEGVEGAGRLRWADTAGQVIEVAGIDLAVCRRFNEMLQGTDPERAPPMDLEVAHGERGWTQGCWAAAGAESGTWFMEVFAGTHCRGADCRSGDVVGLAARRMIQDLPTTPVADATLDPAAALAACAAREATAGERDPQVVAARCTAGV